MTKIRLICIGSFVCSACALSACVDINYNYVKPGGSADAYRADITECIQYANSREIHSTPNAPSYYTVNPTNKGLVVQPDVGSQLSNNAQSFADAVQNVDIIKREQKLCMEAKGYTQAPPKK